MEFIALLMNVGAPAALTYFLMESLPLLAEDSPMIVFLGKALTVKLARRLFSYLLPIIFAGGLSALAVSAGVVDNPAGWPGWLDLIMMNSGISALLGQLGHAYVEGRRAF